MIRINLLPFRAARKKENIRRQASIFFLSLILVLAALVLINFNLSSRMGKLEEKITTTKAELEKYNKDNEEIADIKKKLENLKKKMAVIEELEANRHAPTRLLDTMTKVVVEKRMWFERLETKEKTVDINGIALDEKTVADFMIRLEKTGLFNDVDLRSLRQKKVGASDLKTFDISCQKKSLSNSTQKEKGDKKAKR